MSRLAFNRIHHMDLYRLSGVQEQEFSPLNLKHVFSRALSLIEWPVRLPECLVPSDRLDITIHIAAAVDDVAGDNDDTLARTLILTPRSDAWHRRIQAIQDEGYVDDLLLDEKD